MESANLELNLGYLGAKRASDHADRVIPAWSTVARGLFLRFLAEMGVGATFVAEDARRWCAANGLPDPPDARAFGNLTRFAAAKGLIVDTGRRPRAGSHGREIVEWEIVGIER